jgi:hypothetical protein
MVATTASSVVPTQREISREIEDNMDLLLKQKLLAHTQ